MESASFLLVLLILYTLFFLVLAAVLQWSWNNGVVAAFPACRKLSQSQALLLFVASRILFSSLLHVESTCVCEGPLDPVHHFIHRPFRDSLALAHARLKGS